MQTWRRYWIGLIAVTALTLAGGCGEGEIIGPTTHGEPPDPPVVSAPASPTDVSVAVQVNSAWVRWAPGDRARTQEVVLSSVDGKEPRRVKELKYVTTGTNHVSFADLTWGTSYRVVVAALNEAGRAESAPTEFTIAIPEPPVLTWFSAMRDPTCLSVEWAATGPAKGHRVVVTGATEDAAFEQAVHPLMDVVFCASSYPIIDGMTYNARVVAEYDGLELESKTREFRVDFDPEYSLTGVWRGGFWGFDQYHEYTLELVDSDGDISGSWTWSSYAPAEAIGGRVGADFELTFDNGWDHDNHLSGYFAGPDRIEGMVWPGLVVGVRLQRD